MGYKRSRTLKTILAYLLAAVGLLITLFPIFWVFTISIKTQRDAFTLPPVWIFDPVWENYVRIGKLPVLPKPSETAPSSWSSGCCSPFRWRSPPHMP